VKLSPQQILFFQNKLAYIRDEESYKKLFYHFYPPLVSFCTTILSSKEDAQDVVSESLLKIWSMGKELNYVENLTLYIYKIAKNKCYDMLRKKKREPTAGEYTENASEYVPDETNPDQLYIENELETHIANAVHALPSQSQLVYRLIKEQGFSYKQVTEILGISLNTAETHMRLALKKIRMSLSAYLSGKK